MRDSEIELLVLETKSGSHKAISALYRQLNPPLVKYAYSRVQSKMVAEDLTQNVWLKVTSRIHRLNDVSLFRSWLYKALRWEIVDHFRKTSKESITADLNDVVAPLSTTSNNNTLSLLAKLDTYERDTAELFYINGLTMLEISLVLDVPVGTVKSRLYRARKQLSELITHQ